MQITPIPKTWIIRSAFKSITATVLASATLLCMSGQTRAFGQAQVVDAPYTTGMTMDGTGNDWSNLPSGVITMDTKGRGAGYGTLAVDIKYAWDYTNLYILVKENASYTKASVSAEAFNGTNYQDHPWSCDSVAFWMDLTNGCGLPDGSGGIIVKNNADFQPWFGFSSAGLTNLIYARQDDSGTMNLGGVANCQVATSGTFA